MNHKGSVELLEKGQVFDWSDSVLHFLNIRDNQGKSAQDYAKELGLEATLQRLEYARTR